MTQSSPAPLRTFPAPTEPAKSITINSTNREPSGSDLSTSLTSTDSSSFDSHHMSDSASITSSATSENEEHDVDQKHHPPRIASKTFISQQKTETIEEDPDEDSEDGDMIIAGPVHPGVHITKAADGDSRPVTPPSLRVNTENLLNERPLEMRPHHHKEPANENLPVPNQKQTAERSPSTAISATSTASLGTPLTSAKKEKSFFHLPKLNRSKSQALLPSDSKTHLSLKTSIKNVFSHNSSANSTISIPPTPPSSQPSSAPGTPQLPSSSPECKESPARSKPSLPAQGPRRVASVGPNMMLNKHTPSNSGTVVHPVTMKLEETHEAELGVGHKAINGRSSRAISDPPQNSTLKRAKTLKECGITNRGKHAGKGATSTVTRCQSNGKLLALKAFKKPDRTESDADFKRRIDVEYEIAHSLHHPNVVETMELVWDEGKHNWAETMEWCGGGDLFSIIKSGHMTAVERNCCFKQLIRGVAYMHSMGIAHRDIKPENLLLNENGQLKITDFGVSDVVLKEGGVCRKCRGLCGSEPYMAPEVHTHKEYHGFPLDIWSCGIVYICLAFGGIMWTKAVAGNPGFDRFIAEIRKFEEHQAVKEAKRVAAETAKADVIKEVAKSEDGKSVAEDARSLASDKHMDHLDATKSDIDKASLKSDTDDAMSRISSAISLPRLASPTASPPNGTITPLTPDLSRQNSFPNTPVDRNQPTSTPKRVKSFTSGPVVKPDNMVQSPRPIYEAPGAVKAEVHHPAPRFIPFESFQPLQKRLIYRILDPNPATRITAAEILKDPWFKEIGCCSFDPDELFRVQSGFFDASKASNGRSKAMPVKQNHPNHLINGKVKK